MASFIGANGSLHPYHGEHPQWELTSGSATRDDQVTPLSSGGRSSNYFHTPEESMSLNMSFRSGGDDFNPHGHSHDSMSHRHASQGFQTSLETTDPARPILRLQDSDGQDSFFTPSSPSASGIRSTEDICLPREDGRPNRQEIDHQLGRAGWEDIGRSFVFKTGETVAFENDGVEPAHPDDVQATIPETWVPFTSSNLFLSPNTFIHNHAIDLSDQSQEPSYGGFRAQNTQQSASRSLSSDPWTPLRAMYTQEYQPGPDAVMFAPNDAFGTSGMPFARPAAFQGREVGNIEKVDRVPVHELSGHEDTIDEPPVGDPVGPPVGKFSNSCFGPERPQNAKSLGRHCKLDEVTRQGAKIMRGMGACWPCRLLKYKVPPRRWFYIHKLS